MADAKYDRGVLMVVGHAHGEGRADRLVVRFHETGDGYDLRTIADVPLLGLDFVVLDSGVCVCLDEDDSLELFSRRAGARELERVSDPLLSGDMRLWKQAGSVLLSRGNALFTLRLATS